jgi:thiamine-monophosphate kinase
MPAKSKPGSTHASGELALIERIRARAASLRAPDVKLGIGDDCAILHPRPGEEIVVTTDLSLEGRHFRRDWHSAASIGHRALARGLSDIAAMGARPIAAFLSLALPRGVARNNAWLDGFLDGLLTLAGLHGVTLAGGDTSEAPGDAIIADIMLLGTAPTGRALRRSGAKAGDVLYCTGALGGAAAELDALTAKPSRFKNAKPGDDHPHLFPNPRLAAGQALLRRKLATACIDMSDGLSTDLAHLCAASSVSAEITASALPLHPLAEALSPAARMHAALHGGEDYELLFTAHASTRMPRKLGGIAITPIGRILAQRQKSAEIVLVDAEGRRTALEPHGWEHFRA